MIEHLAAGGSLDGMVAAMVRDTGANPSGCVEIDAMGRTSLPGVHAAGDMAHVAALPMPMASVMTAAASGQVAAASLVATLL